MIFPITTQVNKKLPKQRFYENVSVSSTVKKNFVEQIKAIYWQNKLSADTINLINSKTVTEIEIFRIILNNEIIDETVLKLLDKSIPYHIVFILEYNGKIRLCTAYKDISANGACTLISGYFYTEWAEEDNVELNILGLSLDAIYEGFVRQIANEKIVTKSDSIKTDIETSNKTEKLKKEIVRIDKLARKEKQPKKKFELVKQVNKLRNELERLTN